jgi:hypothetical protein
VERSLDPAIGLLDTVPNPDNRLMRLLDQPVGRSDVLPDPLGDRPARPYRL